MKRFAPGVPETFARRVPTSRQSREQSRTLALSTEVTWRRLDRATQELRGRCAQFPVRGSAWYRSQPGCRQHIQSSEVRRNKFLREFPYDQDVGAADYLGCAADVFFLRQSSRSNVEAMASRTRTASPVTSGPMPSPGEDCDLQEHRNLLCCGIMVTGSWCDLVRECCWPSRVVSRK